MTQLFKMAFRDLGRNKRRSILSSLAVAVGMSLLLLMASVLEGEMRGAIQNTIQLQSGHLQVRAMDYDENKVSLKWEDMIANPQQVIDKLMTLPQVKFATPRLIASGIVTLKDNSKGVQVIGIDPLSEANQVFRQGMIVGDFLTPDDREGIIIGKPLAEKFNVQVGDQVSLLINRSSGDTDERLFTVRGVYTTNTTTYDENTVFMPLIKAQTFAGAEDHASLIFIMLQEQTQAEAVAAALQGSGYQIRTWVDMNEFVVQLEDFAGAYMAVLYLLFLGSLLRLLSTL